MSSSEQKYKRVGWVVEWRTSKKGKWNWWGEHIHRIKSQAIYLYEVNMSLRGSYKIDKELGKARCVPLYVEAE